MPARSREAYRKGTPDTIPHGFLWAPEGSRWNAARIARAVPYVAAGALVAWAIAVGATTALEPRGLAWGGAAGAGVALALRALRWPRAALAVALVAALLIVAGMPASLSLNV